MTLETKSGLEIRNMEVRSVDIDTREITGLAVPYGQTTDIGGYKERFERGAFGDPTDVKLFYGHSDPIGLVTKGEDSDEGFVITARISETTRGNEVYTLMRDGVLNRFSVGFLPVEHRMEDETVVRTKATLKEVSVVAFPAYEGAKVSEVRTSENTNNKEITMENENTYASQSDVADLRDSYEDLSRRLAAFGETKNEVEAPQFRSGAELLKGLAQGSQEARDFATSVEADTVRPGWVSKTLRLKAENRPTINAFDRAPLPASGNSVEYPYVKTVSGTVGVQAAEGDALNYLEVALDTATAPVKTYGGYISLSRQAIERSDLAFLETSLGHMANAYAKRTEKGVADVIAAATLERADSNPLPGTFAGWFNNVLEAAALVEDNGSGSTAELVIVNRAQFNALAGLVDSTGRPLFDVNRDGVNTYATLTQNATALERNYGSLAGLQVVVSRSDLGSPVVAARDAVTTYESAGAPFRLQDEDIVRLTKDFSLYGYMAVGITNPGAIVRIEELSV